MKAIISIIVSAFVFLVSAGFAFAEDEFEVLELRSRGQGVVVDCVGDSIPANAICYSGRGIMTHIGVITWDAYLVMGGVVNIDGTGGACTLASGEAIHWTGNGSEITAAMEGLFCGNNFDFNRDPQILPPYTFNGTYFVTEGTGSFAEARGSGNMCGSTDEFYKVLVNFYGTLVR